MKLSRQAKLCIVGVFQKGLLGLADASELFDELEFEYDQGELKVKNQDVCQVTQEELEMLNSEVKIDA